ncbi:DUF1684 domain-containing protein [Streptomyces sp. NPDC102365]|uniref:DUF1684 domain-containing protein n=1 Tax=Streptomyces sp. NPDC102365 TaxID=3366162 RepID=UPI003827CAE0
MADGFQERGAFRADRSGATPRTPRVARASREGPALERPIRAGSKVIRRGEFWPPPADGRSAAHRRARGAADGRGVRDFAPASPARQAFRGTEGTSYHPRRSAPGRCGRLRLFRQRVRRLSLPFPAPRGARRAGARTTVDLPWAPLPPCAFADHFVCPCPPPRNTLGAEIAAGERGDQRL